MRTYVITEEDLKDPDYAEYIRLLKEESESEELVLLSIQDQQSYVQALYVWEN